MTLLCSIRQAARELRRDRAFLARRLRTLEIEPAGERAGHPVYRVRDLVPAAGRTLFGEPDPEVMTPYERHAHFKAENLLNHINAARAQLLRREDVDAEWARVLKVIELELDQGLEDLGQEVGRPSLVMDRIDSKFAAIRQILTNAKPRVAA